MTTPSPALRKLVLVKETVFAEVGQPAARPITRAAVLMVIANPYAGRFEPDLSQLIDLGPQLAERHLRAAVALMPHTPVAYGKAAIVGVAGELEHAAAVLHPKLGKPMRAAVGGGEAIIPSTTKVASAGARIDVPLGNKDNVWSFNELDTLTVGVEDAPRPDEILVVLAVADGGRPHARVGAGRLAV
jgi:hypothetical protein